MTILTFSSNVIKSIVLYVLHGSNHPHTQSVTHTRRRLTRLWSKYENLWVGPAVPADSPACQQLQLSQPSSSSCLCMAGTDERRLKSLLAAAEAGHPAGECRCRLVRVETELLKVLQFVQDRTELSSVGTVSSNVGMRTGTRSWQSTTSIRRPWSVSPMN